MSVVSEVTQHPEFNRSTRRLLAKMLEGREITESGLNWLVEATDPFHDSPIAVSGYPDISPDRSIAQLITRTTTIKAPSSVTGNWSCYVMAVPICPNFSAFSMDYNTPYLSAGVVSGDVYSPPAVNTTTAKFYSGVTIFTGDDQFEYLSTGEVLETFSDVSVPPQFTQNEHRLVAMGYEVVNTTSDLYKQGSVTIARTPNSSRLASYRYNPPEREAKDKRLGVIDTTPTMFRLGHCPPQALSDLALFPDSRTWAASKGAYVVSTLNDTNVPRIRPAPCPVLFTPSQSEPSSSGGLICFGNYRGDACDIYPFDWTCCYFSGLSPQTTLQVTARYYIERFPAETESNLVVLTNPPTPFDPMALMLYGRALQHLPVAVPVGENPLGEWFNKVVSAVGPAIPKMLPVVAGGAGTMIGGPGAGAVARAVSSQVANMLENKSKAAAKPNPKKKTRIKKSSRGNTQSNASRSRNKR